MAGARADPRAPAAGQRARRAAAGRREAPAAAGLRDQAAAAADFRAAAARPVVAVLQEAGETMATRPISPQDHERVADAIRAAETRTDGEIYCVVAHASDGYFAPAALMGTLCMLVVSLAVAYGLEAWWLTIRLPHFVLAQLL